tara:strand:- start:618 stop:1130 length:513 start_codon:yes stop_codon:yes gene_type:complete
MAKTLYKEKQNLLSYDFRWVFFAFVGLFGYIIIHQYFVRHLNLHPGELIAGGLCVALILGIIWILTHMSLRTKISKKGITYRFKPLHTSKKLIRWTDISSVQVVSNPKFSSWENGFNNYYTNKKFTFSGHNGVRVETHSGERIFIGTNNVERLKDAIERAIKKSKASKID